MKLIIEEPSSTQEEDTIIVKARHLSDAQWKLLHQLTSQNRSLRAYQGGKISLVDPSFVYYFESVDNKVFLYTEHDVYEIRQKLYEIEEQYPGFDFFRISKSIILNLTKIQSLSPVLGSRLEATLLNDEKVIISRQYVTALKALLGL